MKNLKKVLALVLVVAMIMGLALSASAKFTDADKINYKEAVDVMAAIGVINGYTDGSFGPAKSVTRAEMAKMVAYILNSGEDIGTLYSAANTYSDCTNNWAKGYIAYASKTGYVAGIGGGKFNPNGTVTGVQAAKMLLCALGYDATIQKYVGSDWAVNVLKDAKAAKLLKGLEKVDLGKALTREQAAQMMFNALKATMVDYAERGTSITINGVEIATGASKPSTDGQTALYVKYFGADDGNLHQTDSKSDDFGRPAHTWQFDKKDVGTYADAAELTYTEAVKLGTIYTDLGKVKYEKANVAVFTDSKTSSNAAADVDSGVKTELGGQGTLVEVYKTEKTVSGSTVDTLTVVVVNTFVGKIDAFTKAVTNKDGEVTTKAKVTIKQTDGKVIPSIANSGAFETETYTKDDVGTYVLYTKADNEIKSVTTAKSFDGVMTKYNDSSVTVAGTTYNKAAQAGTYHADDYASTWTYYTDDYGNVIFGEVKEEVATKDYAYVTQIQGKVTAGLYDGSTRSVKAEIVLTDGTKKIVDIALTKDGDVYKYDKPVKDGTVSAKQTLDKDFAADKIDYWFSYSINSDGKYTFKPVNSTYAAVVASMALVKDSAGKYSDHYTDSKTAFTFVDGDSKVTSYTGMPVKDVTLTKALITYGKDAKNISYVYAVEQSGSFSTASATYAYSIKKDGNVADGNEDWVFAIDGKQVTYTVTDSSKPAAGNIYDLTISDGKVTTAALVSSGVTSATVDNYNGDFVAFKSDSTLYKFADKFACYNVDPDLDSAERGKADTMEAGDVVTYVVVDGKIAVAYITAEAE